MSGELARLARRVVVVGAWLFIGASIAGISWLAIDLVRSDFTGTGYLFFSATVDNRTEGGPGLSYHALPGFLLAIAEVAVIAVSLICTCRHDVIARRLGHVVLVAWASVPLYGAIRLYTLSGSNVLLLSVAVMAGCWACVLLRAVWGWTPRRSAGSPPPGAEATSVVTPC